MRDENEKYPPRIVSRGKLPMRNKSINHYCTLRKITVMRSYFGDDAYLDKKKNSTLGIILKFASAEFTWVERHVQYLLGNKLEIAKPEEMWVLADGRPIRFSLYEFEHITQLNCGLPDAYDREFAAGDLWKNMGLTHGDGPTWGELENALHDCKDWSFEKRKMVGLLVVLNVGIFGLHKNSRIPLFHAKLVMDPDRFERYPWAE